MTKISTSGETLRKPCAGSDGSRPDRHRYAAGKLRAVSVGIELFVRRLSAEVAPNSSLMQDMLQRDRNPLF